MPSGLKRKQRRRGQGFTLIELMVTVFIIGLLIAILVPKFTSAQDQAKQTVCLSRERSATLGLIAYANQNHDKLPLPGPEVDGVSPRELLTRPPFVVINTGIMIGDTLPDPQTLYCPSATRANFTRDYSLKQTEPVACDYAYGLSMKPGKAGSIGSLGSVAILADNFVATDEGNGPGLGDFTHRKGYNVSFTDGSAIFYRDPTGFIADQKIQYDNENDEFDFSHLTPEGKAPDGSPPTMRIYEAWFAFSFNKRL